MQSLRLMRAVASQEWACDVSQRPTFTFWVIVDVFMILLPCFDKFAAVLPNLLSSFPKLIIFLNLLLTFWIWCHALKFAVTFGCHFFFNVYEMITLLFFGYVVVFLLWLFGFFWFCCSVIALVIHLFSWFCCVFWFTVLILVMLFCFCCCISWFAVLFWFVNAFMYAPLYSEPDTLKYHKGIYA